MEEREKRCGMYIPVNVSLLVIWFVRQHFRCHVDGRANSSFILTCPLHLGQTKIYYDDVGGYYQSSIMGMVRVQCTYLPLLRPNSYLREHCASSSPSAFREKVNNSTTLRSERNKG